MSHSLTSGHEGFYLREGWIAKGIKAIKENENSDIFLSSNILYAIDTLGIGSNMVKSLKFWLEKIGAITKEGKRLVIDKKIEIILKNDRYMQNLNSLWLLHYFLRKNGNIEVWDIIFSDNNDSFFTRDSIQKFLEIKLKDYKGKTIKFTEKALKTAIYVFLKTYLWEKKVDDPESNIISPLARLKILIEDQEKRIFFRDIDFHELSPLLIHYILFENNSGQIGLEEGYRKLRKIVKMDINNYKNILKLLELDKTILVDRAAGIDNIYNKETFKNDEILIEKMLRN